MKDYTEIVFILDRSGSMTGLESDTIGGFNAMLAKHRKAKGNAVVSTVLFDDRTDVICDRVDIDDVKPLTAEDYYVRGCTALLDAVGGAIHHVSHVQKILPKRHRAKDVLFVITTDGLENASRTYDYPTVKDIIERKKRKGWEFIFMGANIDAAAEAARIGIGANRVANYHADARGTKAVFGAIADATRMMREERLIDEGWSEKIERDNRSRVH